MHFYRRRDVVLSFLHITFTALLFSPNMWRGGEGEGATAVPPVFQVVDPTKAGDQGGGRHVRLMPIDHLRFNVQWTLVIWSFFLYPCIFADLCVNAGDRTHRVGSATADTQDDSKPPNAQISSSVAVLEGGGRSQRRKEFNCANATNRCGYNLLQWAEISVLSTRHH